MKGGKFPPTARLPTPSSLPVDRSSPGCCLIRPFRATKPCPYASTMSDAGKRAAAAAAGGRFARERERGRGIERCRPSSSRSSLTRGWPLTRRPQQPLPAPPRVAPVRRHQHRLQDSGGAPSSTARPLASLRRGAATSQALIRPRKSVQAHASNLPYPFFPAGGSSTLRPAVTR